MSDDTCYGKSIGRITTMGPANYCVLYQDGKITENQCCNQELKLYSVGLVKKLCRSVNRSEWHLISNTKII